MMTYLFGDASAFDKGFSKMLKIATGVSMCETNKRQIRFLPFIVAVLTFVRVTVGKSSIKRIIIETKVSQHSLSLSDQLHMNARKQPSSPPWEAGLQHFSSSLSPSFQLSPPPPVRNRAVNLLRLTPGFVTDVYLVCKKCFYVVSKYVWAQRVMMLLYCQGGKQCSKGASADPQTPYAHSLSFFHSQGSLPRPLPLYTTTCMDKHLPAYKHALFSLTNRHSYAWGHTHAHAWTLLSHHHPLWPFWLLFVSHVCGVSRTFLSWGCSAGWNRPGPNAMSHTGHQRGRTLLYTNCVGNKFATANRIRRKVHCDRFS